MKKKIKKTYGFEELKDRGKALEWLSKNLDTPRPLRMPQLLITGVVEALKKCLEIYDIRKDDFSGFVDLWFIDEFTANRMPEQALNKVLDGSSVTLKNGQVFSKRLNVPIILVSHDVPNFQTISQRKSFLTRIEECNFEELDEISYLDDDRVAKTLLIMVQYKKTRIKRF